MSEEINFNDINDLTLFNPPPKEALENLSITNRYLDSLINKIKPNDSEYKEYINYADSLRKKLYLAFNKILGFKRVYLFGSVYKRTMLKENIKKADFDFLIVFEFNSIKLAYEQCLLTLKTFEQSTVKENGSTLIIQNDVTIEIVPAIIIGREIKVRCSEGRFDYNIHMYEYLNKIPVSIIAPDDELRALNSYENLRELIILGKYWQYIHNIKFDSFRLESCITEIISGQKGYSDFKGKNKTYSREQMAHYFNKFPALSIIIPLLLIFLENSSDILNTAQGKSLMLEIINQMKHPSTKSLDSIFKNKNSIQHFV